MFAQINDFKNPEQAQHKAPVSMLQIDKPRQKPVPRKQLYNLQPVLAQLSMLKPRAFLTDKHEPVHLEQKSPSIHPPVFASLPMMNPGAFATKNSPKKVRIYETGNTFHIY
jgi:hypothetical protein